MNHWTFFTQQAALVPKCDSQSVKNVKPVLTKIKAVSEAGQNSQYMKFDILMHNFYHISTSPTSRHTHTLTHKTPTTLPKGSLKMCVCVCMCVCVLIKGSRSSEGLHCWQMFGSTHTLIDASWENTKTHLAWTHTCTNTHTCTHTLRCTI